MTMTTERTARAQMAAKAIAILACTRDGNDLLPAHLKLVEMAVNDRLNDAGVAEFERLHESVAVLRNYVKPWFHDQEHLTNEHSGYVYWKGACVEHYSFRDVDREREAAHALAAKCRRLEASGFRPTLSSVDSADVLLSLYEHPQGREWAQLRERITVYEIGERVRPAAPASTSGGLHAVGIDSGPPAKEGAIMFWVRPGPDGSAPALIAMVSVSDDVAREPALVLPPEDDDRSNAVYYALWKHGFRPPAAPAPPFGLAVVSDVESSQTTFLKALPETHQASTTGAVNVRDDADAWIEWTRQFGFTPDAFESAAAAALTALREVSAAAGDPRRRTDAQRC
jgi:hypothetical protein